MNTVEKILVVDDDPNLRKTLADILRVKGYETAVAGTGAEAIAAMATREYQPCPDRSDAAGHARS